MKWNKTLASLFILGIKDFRLSPELRSFLKEFPVSGISLFNSPHDSEDFIWKDPDTALEVLYEFLNEIGAHIHFLAVDQEGGRVQRLKKPFITLPAAGKIGEFFKEEGRPDQIFQVYQLAARQLALCQIQLNFAPVCDLRTPDSHSIIGDRSFGDKPQNVISLVKLFCEAMNSEGIACTLKHFPGHGPSRLDSHESVAIIEKHREDYQREDRFIFEECATYAFSIMTGHLAHAEHPNKILSLDREFIQESREKMPSHLVWMTDDLLTMKAVNELDPWIACIEAGYDFLNICGSLDASARAIESSIRYFEKLPMTFQDEQKLEMRCRHAREYFEQPTKLLPFKKWKQEILELSEKAAEILENESLV